MTFQEFVVQLSELDHDGADPGWTLRDKLWRELTQQVEVALTSIVPEGFCTAQDWDNRTDCQVKLADGQIVGEMIGLSDLSEVRLNAIAERLRRRRAGESVTLVNALWGPIAIGVARPSKSS